MGRARLLLTVAAAALAAGRISSAFPTKNPRFSWDTLPVFHHGSNASGPYSDDAVQTLARFPMVVIEKWQDLNGGDNKTEEERIMYDGRRIKAINPNVSVIFYYNAVCDFQNYGMGHEFMQHPEFWLRDKDGQPVNMSCAGFGELGPAPDFAVPGARDLFVSTCANAAKTGAVDGCFVDRYLTNVSTKLSPQTRDAYWTGKRLMLQELQAAVPGPVASNHMCNTPPSSYIDGVWGCEVETLQNSEAQVTNLQEAARREVVVEAVAKHCTDTEVDIPDLATFLLGAGRLAYFACVNGWSADGKHGVRWYPEFDLKLGEPDGSAVKGADGTWTRRFASGTVASANFATKKYSVAWAGQPATPAPAPTPAPPPPPPPPAPGACDSMKNATGISGSDITPKPWGKHTAPGAAECCAACWAVPACVAWTWYSDNGAKGQCHQHSSYEGMHQRDSRISGVIRP